MSLSNIEAIFDLLAILYLKVPDKELLTALSQMVPDGDLFLKDSIKAIQDDYQALFTLTDSGRYLPPFESLAGGNGDLDDSAKRVAVYFRETGFDHRHLEVDRHWKKDLQVDHIGVEFAFLKVLLQTAQAAGDARQGLIDSAKYFFEEHICKWAGEYGKKITANAQTELYQALGRLTTAIAEPAFFKTK